MILLYHILGTKRLGLSQEISGWLAGTKWLTIGPRPSPVNKVAEHIKAR